MYINAGNKSYTTDQAFFEYTPNTRYEFNVIEWCKENFADKNKVFLDVGSHIGTYAWSLAPYFSHTYAFECNPEVFQVLQQNCDLRKLFKDLTVVNRAVSNETGIVNYILRSPDGGGNGLIPKENEEDVPVLMTGAVTLDTFFSGGIENIGLIKLDIEGSEKNALMGAVSILKQSNYPPIVFESWAPEMGKFEADLRKELFDYIHSLGYKIQPISNTADMFLATM